MTEHGTALTTSRLPALDYRAARGLALRLLLPLAGYYAAALFLPRSAMGGVGDLVFPLIATWFLLAYIEGVKSVEMRGPSDVRPISFSGALTGMGLALIGLVIITGGFILYALWAVPGGPAVTDALRPGGMSFGELLHSRAVAMAVAAKEEILFRALLLRWLLYFMPPGRAVLLQAVAFGAEHWVFGGFAIFNATLVGITLGILYLRTNNLWMVIGFHFAWDFFIFVLAGGVGNYTRNLNTTQQAELDVVYLAVYLLCQAALILIALWITRKPGRLLRPT